MYKIKYTKQSFEEVLQEAYDSLTSEDVINLLNECRDRCLIVPELEDQFILSIYRSVKKKRNISFKEWKAISAYVAECKRKVAAKNNKTF